MSGIAVPPLIGKLIARIGKVTFGQPCVVTVYGVRVRMSGSPLSAVPYWFEISVPIGTGAGAFSTKLMTPSSVALTDPWAVVPSRFDPLGGETVSANVQPAKNGCRTYIPLASVVVASQEGGWHSCTTA